MKYAYDLSAPIGHKATLGLIALQADETIEHDMRRLLPLDGVAFYVSRVPSGLEVTGDTLAEMANSLPTAAGLFPKSVSFDAVGYGCTSGTSVIGAQKVADLVRNGCSTDHVSEPLTALIAACQSLKVSRLAFLSPYIESVSATLRDALLKAGIQCPVFGSFEEAEEAKVARIDPAAIAAAAIDLGRRAETDAIFLSCTNLRTLDIIEEVETVTSKPVLSSNQVLVWHLMTLGGLSSPSNSPGRLFKA